MSTTIIEKVKKLIKLGTNEGAADGERENAMRMAHALLAKHNLSMNDLTDEVDRVEDHFDIWQDKYMVIATCAMAKLFFCFPYITRKAGEKGRDRVFFIGRRDNVETAKVMSEYVIKSIRSEMTKQRLGNSFANGAAARVSERVRQIIENPADGELSDSMALAVVSLHKTEDSANQEFLSKNKGLTLVTAKSKKMNVNREEYQKGREFGDKINLNRQLDSTQKKPTLIK